MGNKKFTSQGKPLWFNCPRTCGRCSDAVQVISTWFHAHTLAREMYFEIIRNGTRFNVGSDPIWNFHDQGGTYGRNVSFLLQAGDRVEASCIWDSSSKSIPTHMGHLTSDEMCLSHLIALVPERHAQRSWWGTQYLLCDGPYWSGDLTPDEPGYDLQSRHPRNSSLSFWGCGADQVCFRPTRSVNMLS